MITFLSINLICVHPPFCIALRFPWPIAFTSVISFHSRWSRIRTLYLQLSGHTLCHVQSFISFSEAIPILSRSLYFAIGPLRVSLFRVFFRHLLFFFFFLSLFSLSAFSLSRECSVARCDHVIESLSLNVLLSHLSPLSLLTTICREYSPLGEGSLYSWSPL